MKRNVLILFTNRTDFKLLIQKLILSIFNLKANVFFLKAKQITETTTFHSIHDILNKNKFPTIAMKF